MVPWNQKYLFLPSQSPGSRDRNNIEREAFFKDPSLCIIQQTKVYARKTSIYRPYQKSIAATFSETIVPLNKVQHCGWTINTLGSAGKFPEFFTEHEF